MKKFIEEIFNPYTGLRDPFLGPFYVLAIGVIIFGVIFFFIAIANAAEIWPDENLTMGAVRIDGHSPALTCGHAREHRGYMSPDRRDHILLEYHLPPGTHPTYEIDHLIPLCLGGADEASNLWPQPRRQIEPVWNAEAKDRLENRLCSMVCAGELDIATAQQDIAVDWIAAYRKYFNAQNPYPTDRED